MQMMMGVFFLQNPLHLVDALMTTLDLFSQVSDYKINKQNWYF